MLKLFFAAIATALLIAGTWLGRGLYDEIALYSGYFHVVNAIGETATFSLVFPNGTQKTTTLKPAGVVDWQIPKTGEGAIQVTVNGTDLGKVGYVTSHNNLTVICLTAKEAIFSQVFLQGHK